LIFPFLKQPDGTLKQDVVILLHVVSPLKLPDQMCTLRASTPVWTNGVSTYYLELNSKRIQKSINQSGKRRSWRLLTSHSINQARVKLGLSLFHLVRHQNMTIGPVSSPPAIRPGTRIWAKIALRNFERYSLHLYCLSLLSHRQAATTCDSWYPRSES
jgi:hypothetical protein